MLYHADRISVPVSDQYVVQYDLTSNAEYFRWVVMGGLFGILVSRKGDELKGGAAWAAIFGGVPIITKKIVEWRGQ